jgi:hypothetical protein
MYGEMDRLRQVLDSWHCTQQSYADTTVEYVKVVAVPGPLLKALSIVSPLLSTGPIWFSLEQAAYTV